MLHTHPFGPSLWQPSLHRSCCFPCLSNEEMRRGRGEADCLESVKPLVGRTSETLNAEPVSPCAEHVRPAPDTNTKTVICPQEEEVGMQMKNHRKATRMGGFMSSGYLTALCVWLPLHYSDQKIETFSKESKTVRAWEGRCHIFEFLPCSKHRAICTHCTSY